MNEYIRSQKNRFTQEYEVLLFEQAENQAKIKNESISRNTPT